MRILSWNCNGAFRKKIERTDVFDADLLVIQECEDPSESTNAFQNRVGPNYFWRGDNKNRGIGIFWNGTTKVEILDWEDDGLQIFLPCRLNKNTVLIGVWTKYANSPSYGYIGQFWKYLQLHKDKLVDQKVLIAGDFNSNVRWDKPHRWWNHSDVVRELEEIGIVSLYHKLNKLPQGSEPQPTLFLQRNLDKPYHVDHIFASKKLISENARHTIGAADEWLRHSDHMPILAELQIG